MKSSERTENHTVSSRVTLAVTSAIAAALIITLAVLIIRAAMSDNQAPPSTQSSPAFLGGRSSILLKRARSILARGQSRTNLAEARVLAEQSFAADPLQQDALTLLSQIAVLQGDPTRATALLDIAAEYSRRDARTQILLINHLVLGGDYAGAIDRVDMLLRTHGDISSQLMAFLVSIARDPRSYKALAAYMAGNPPWRGALLADLATPKIAPEVSLRLLRAMAAQGATVDHSDVEPLIDEMAQKGHLRQAYLTWIDFLPTSYQSEVGLLFDGDFKHAPSTIPFEWQATASPFASVDFAPGPRLVGPRALRVEFSGGQTPYLNIGQTLFLPVGSYALTVQAKSEGLIAHRGLVWQVSCISPAPTVLGTTDAVIGTTAWHQQTVKFTVPAKQCTFQTLKLVLPARSPLEEVANGMAEFAELRLRKVQ